MQYNVLVTGGAGFIGSHLAERLAKKGMFVRIIDNFSTGSWDNLKFLKQKNNVEIVNGDLKNDELYQRNILDNIDVVFHFAANPEVRISSTLPEVHFNENIVATFKLLEAIRKKGNVKTIVFASSSSVYGEPKTIPVTEDAPIRPVSVYGASKAACEVLIHSYSTLYGIRAIILRYANVVGPRLRHGVIYDFYMKLMRDPYELEILGDGLQVRSFIYISDAIDATLLTVEKTKTMFEVFNVASEDWITINDVANIVLRVLGLNRTKIRYKPLYHGIGWPGDVKKIALSISKIKKLGFKPKYTSKEAVELTIKSYLED
ncbi:SDR family NAD(P)-dependent oxidoreductase [Desulfurococcaceae archaeon MEX13E-LK6-19]|nr:SDR family NAD(P)-dependent oxidoreductase [Desulfurococcaceae archaeon MEX13E-LK6-19]